MSWWKNLFGLATNLPQPSVKQGPPVSTERDRPLSQTPAEDALYYAAVDYVMSAQSISISGLQRALKIGYSRSADLIEAMERDAFVSAMDANGRRRILSDTERETLLRAPPESAQPLTAAVVRKKSKGSAGKPILVRAADLPPLTGRITGNHQCGFEIVGESHYQVALKRLRNSRAMSTDNNFIADIVTEPDNPHDCNACAVYIENYKVGYLPKAAAAEFVRQIGDMGVAGVCRFQTAAKLAGGWGNRPMIGVLVSLPKT
jgi:hypothetical protein